MRTRAELAEEAKKNHKATIKRLESEIALAMARKQETVEHSCNAEVYAELKPEIEKAGFRTKWLNLQSRCHSPKMIIYI